MQVRSDASFGVVAYFSMEVGLEPDIPTYSGGLGILAGDTLRSAADLGVSMVGITLLHRKGYFRQELDHQGNRIEHPDIWNPEAVLEPLEVKVALTIDGRPIRVRAWRYGLRGLSGHKVPVYFLDTALPENDPFDQTLTHHLYGGDAYYRLCQEAVLGIGGITLLAELGWQDNVVYHMNEGHSALLTLGLLEREIQDYARTSLEWNKGALERRSHKPAFEIIVVYSQGEGALDIFFQGPIKTVRDLQVIFSRTVLKTEIPPEEKDKRVYDLNGSGINDAVIKKLRLSTVGESPAPHGGMRFAFPPYILTRLHPL